jgi:hypothetical protein
MKKPTTRSKPASRKVSKPAPPAPAATKENPAKAANSEKAAPKRMSGLDAAARVLAESKEPLGCAEICARILKRKLWATNGKTPAATLNAAMLREVKAKGKESRFRKAGRGLFAAAGKGA